MRLFVAVDLPEKIKKQVERVCTGVPDMRWVKPSQMHLTLRFIGEVEKPRYEQIHDALAQIRFEAFTTALHGVGQFPPKGKARVLWVGMTKSETLIQLARQVEQSIVALGFSPEDKPFSPHITLARLKFPPPPAALEQFFSKNAAFHTEPFPVTNFVLYSSTLLSGGASYHREAVYEAQA